MVLQRWTPRSLAAWRPLREMESTLDRYLEDWPFRAMWRRPDGGMGWSPSMNVYEKDDSFVVRTELPGVDMEDIDISMVGNTLTVKGERRESSELEDEECECSEISYGSFSRSITFSEPIQAGKIDATMDNGVLEIMLPKMPEAKSGKIHIKAKGMAASKAKTEEKTKSKAKKA